MFLFTLHILVQGGVNILMIMFEQCNRGTMFNVYLACPYVEGGKFGKTHLKRIMKG